MYSGHVVICTLCHFCVFFKYLEQLQSWLEDQSLGKTELADNLNDAELQRDIFNRQYNQQVEECNLLIERGWEVNDHQGKLDALMFGEGVVTGKIMKEKVDMSIVEVEKAKNDMMKKAEPHMKQLNDCVLLYQLEKNSRRLTEDLKLLSGKISGLPDVGQTLEESDEIQSSMEHIEKQFKVASKYKYTVQLICILLWLIYLQYYNTTIITTNVYLDAWNTKLLHTL